MSELGEYLRIAPTGLDRALKSPKQELELPKWILGEHDGRPRAR